MKKYMPAAYEKLSSVRVISARSEYEDIFPTAVEQWKMHAFLLAKLDANIEMLTNIISVGDSEKDAIAAHNLAKFGLFFLTGRN